MLYHPPTGATDPNADYVDYNATSGTQGSKVPGKAVGYTQREVLALVDEAGLVRTDTDLKQALRAVRSGKLSYYQDAGAPNALILTSITAHTGYVPGLPLCIRLANDVTGATTLNLDGLGVLSVVFPGGGPLQRQGTEGHPEAQGKLLRHAGEARRGAHLGLVEVGIGDGIHAGELHRAAAAADEQDHQHQ